MKTGKITAKVRDAVMVCFIVEGKEIHRYKNIELPDELKQIDLKRYELKEHLDGKIALDITYEKGVLPETFPKPKNKVTRAEKAAAKAALIKAEPQKPAAPKKEPQKPAAPKAEPQKPIAPKAEPQKPAAPKAEPQKPIAPQAEPQKANKVLNVKESMEATKSAQMASKAPKKAIIPFEK